MLDIGKIGNKTWNGYLHIVNHLAGNTDVELCTTRLGVMKFRMLSKYMSGRSGKAFLALLSLTSAWENEEQFAGQNDGNGELWEHSRFWGTNHMKALKWNKKRHFGGTEGNWKKTRRKNSIG